MCVFKYVTMRFKRRADGTFAQVDSSSSKTTKVKKKTTASPAVIQPETNTNTRSKRTKYVPGKYSKLISGETNSKYVTTRQDRATESKLAKERDPELKLYRDKGLFDKTTELQEAKKKLILFTQTVFPGHRNPCKIKANRTANMRLLRKKIADLAGHKGKYAYVFYKKSKSNNPVATGKAYIKYKKFPPVNSKRASPIDRSLPRKRCPAPFKYYDLQDWNFFIDQEKYLPSEYKNNKELRDVKLDETQLGKDFKQLSADKKKDKILKIIDEYVNKNDADTASALQKQYKISELDIIDRYGMSFNDEVKSYQADYDTDNDLDDDTASRPWYDDGIDLNQVSPQSRRKHLIDDEARVARKKKKKKSKKR